MLNPVYDAIFDEWEAELDDLTVKIFQSLRQAYPESRTRRALIKDVYGVTIPANADLNNNKYDRKIRLTIARMFDDLIPVVSSSSKAGYRLDLSEETLRKLVGEFERRRNQYEAKVRRGNELILKIRQFGDRVMPVQVSRPAQVKQLNFYGEQS